jgi:WD40 repeat protein
VPKEYLDGKHSLQLTIAGSGGAEVAVEPLSPPQGFVTLSTDGNYLAVTHNKNLYLFDTSSDTPLWSYTADYLFNKPARLSSDGACILVAGQKTNLYLGPHTLLLLHKSNPAYLWARDMAGYLTAIISTDGNRVAVIEFAENKVPLLDTLSGNLICELVGDSTDITPIEDIAMSSDGEYIAVTRLNGISLFDGFKGSLLWKYSLPSLHNLEAVAISPDGSYIGAVCSASQPPSQAGGQFSHTQEVIVFQRDGNTPIWRHESSVSSSVTAYHSVAISADGNRVVAWSDSKLTLFSITSSTPVWSKEDFPKSISSVSVSSDASYIVVGCGDNTAYLLDRAGSVLWSRAGIGKRVAISQNGETIAVSSNTSVHLLNAVGSTIWTFQYE